jgi:excinuclease ABC subunit A
LVRFSLEVLGERKSMKNHNIRVRGCRQHNLKNIDIDIPHHTIVAITGVSGSGKSSLAFDTIFIEGQRRYMECLSPQIRSTLRQFPKPDADLIEGLSPTLAIGQGRGVLYSRSTVATQTDIYDFLSLLYARVGQQHSPATGKVLQRYTHQEIVEKILREYPQGMKIQIYSPIDLTKEAFPAAIARLQKMGFVRFRCDGEEFFAEDEMPEGDKEIALELIVDRLEIKEGVRDRLSASIKTALEYGRGIIKVQEGRDGEIHYYTEVYVCPETGISFAPLDVKDFNFNSLHGACPRCHGRGGREGTEDFFLDKDLATTDQVLDIIEKCSRKRRRHYEAAWEAFAAKYSVTDGDLFASHDEELQHDIVAGGGEAFTVETTQGDAVYSIETSWKGLVAIIEEDLEERKGKSPFSSEGYVCWQVCPECGGGRLKKESLWCKIYDKGIHEISSLTIEAACAMIKAWSFDGKEKDIAGGIVPEILSRLTFLCDVGLGYLELDRQTVTLSEGEGQRVQLASQIGAKLSGVTYILDEPSRGLHKRDVQHLVKVVFSLRDLQNTLIIVEHDKELISHSDVVIELGAGAGLHGGEVVYHGTYEGIQHADTKTGRWLQEKVTVPKSNKKKAGAMLGVHDVSCHNIHNFSLDIPLCSLVGFCGVSGSGKSTLVVDVIAREMKDILHKRKQSSLLKGSHYIHRLVVVDQKHAGINPRSTPATFVGVMTSLRSLFSQTRLARARGYTPGHFSLMKRGGRCDACDGMGQMRISMPFMADVYTTCDICGGQRYNFETLQVAWEGDSIAEVLSMTVEEAAVKFKNIPDIANRLTLMKDVGLEYMLLGQPMNTLSSGEVQRLKLVAELVRKSEEHTLYIFDEPTAGLHHYDIKKLTTIMRGLVEKGHSVFVVEHNVDVLREADWLIELGPGGGPYGGTCIFEGTPYAMTKKTTPTAGVLL